VRVDPRVVDRAFRAVGSDTSLAAALGAMPDEWRTNVLAHVALAGAAPDRQRRLLELADPEVRQHLRGWLAAHRDATPIEIVVEGLAQFYGPRWLQARVQSRRRAAAPSGRWSRGQR
jgi:hypothetical protein